MGLFSLSSPLISQMQIYFCIYPSVMSVKRARVSFAHGNRFFFGLYNISAEHWSSQHRLTGWGRVRKKQLISIKMMHTARLKFARTHNTHEKKKKDNAVTTVKTFRGTSIRHSFICLHSIHVNRTRNETQWNLNEKNAFASDWFAFIRWMNNGKWIRCESIQFSIDHALHTFRLYFEK